MPTTGLRCGKRRQAWKAEAASLENPATDLLTSTEPVPTHKKEGRSGREDFLGNEVSVQILIGCAGRSLDFQSYPKLAFGLPFPFLLAGSGNGPRIAVSGSIHPLVSPPSIFTYWRLFFLRARAFRAVTRAPAAGGSGDSLILVL